MARRRRHFLSTAALPLLPATALAMAMAAVARSLALPLLLDTWTAVPVTRSLVKLGVPDAVPKEGAVGVKALAAMVGAEPSILYRAIRFVAGVGVFREQGEDLISHSETSVQLCRGGLLRNKVLYRASEEIVMPYVSGFTSVLRDPSRSGFQHLHGEDYFTSWLPQHPESEALFGQFMTEAARTQVPLILDAYPWPTSGTIADIGGSNGHLLRGLLTKLPGVSGVLFDLPSVIATAKAHWPEGDVMHSSRVAFHPGDFFTAVDVAADVYVLKWILHDWADERCVSILSNIRSAAKYANSVVLVIDIQVPEDLPNEHHLAKFFDMHMAAGYGGKERTASQMRALAAAAGWELHKILPVGASPFHCFVLRQPGACADP